MMERIFRKYLHFANTFFDDILVHSKALEEHYEYLDLVFKEVHAHQLFINAKKSEFFLQEILYLGHIISHGKVKVDPSKLIAIQEWPDLENVHITAIIGSLSNTLLKSLRLFMLSQRRLYCLPSDISEDCFSEAEISSHAWTSTWYP